MTILHMKQNLIKTLGNPSYNELVDLINENTELECKTGLEAVEMRFEKKLLEVKCELSNRMDSHFRWMISMWLTQMLALIAILKSLIH